MRRNKKQLYEAIMRDVAKTVKRCLNEDNNILTLAETIEKDMSDFLKNNQLMQIIYNNKDDKAELFLIFVLKKILESQNKKYTLSVPFNGSRKDFLNYIKNIKENVIIIEDDGNMTETLKLLQDLMDTMDLSFQQLILLSTEDKNSLSDFVQTFNEPCEFKTMELK